MIKPSLERINKAALKFLEPLTTEKTFETIAKEAIKLVHGDDATIILRNLGLWHIAYSSSELPKSLKPRNNGYAYTSFRERTIIVLDAKKAYDIHPEVKHEGIKSVIFIPLSYKNKSIGVLIVRSFKSRQFVINEPEVLRLFGSIASLAIRKTQLYSEAKKSVAVRDLFISIASHELRTPLTSINGYIDLLYKKLANGNSLESKWIKNLSVEGSRLTNLVKELLEINRIQSGKLQYYFKEYCLVDIINRAIDNFYFLYPDRKIIFKNNYCDGKCKIVCDQEKMLQVIDNVLENGVKYSPPEKEITVILVSKPSYFIVNVMDHGIGIPKNEIPLIFKGFYQGQNNFTEKGMGLGLFLAKNIIDHHRGMIKVQSKLKSGTIVKIILPKARTRI